MSQIASNEYTEFPCYEDALHYDNYYAYTTAPPLDYDIEYRTEAPNGEIVQKRAKIAFFNVKSLGHTVRAVIAKQCFYWNMPVLEVDVRVDRRYGSPIAAFVLLNWSYDEAAAWIATFHDFIEHDHGYGWRVEMAQIQPQQLTLEQLNLVECKKRQRAEEKRRNKTAEGPQPWDPASYKTRMCYHMKTVGQCPHGNNCRFAHNAIELREAPNAECPPVSRFH